MALAAIPPSTCFAKARCFKTGLTDLPPGQDNSVQAYQGFGSSHLLLIQSNFLIFHPHQSINFTFLCLCRKLFISIQMRISYVQHMSDSHIFRCFQNKNTPVNISWKMKGSLEVERRGNWLLLFSCQLLSRATAPLPKECHQLDSRPQPRLIIGN